MSGGRAILGGSGRVARPMTSAGAVSEEGRSTTISPAPTPRARLFL